MTVVDAYRRCEQITSAEARNFSYGIRLLPISKRRAMSALYALARRIDDVGDGEGAVAERAAALAALRKGVAGLAIGDVPADDPVLVAMADVVAKYPVPITALEELIDGCEMDLAGKRYRTMEDLVGYCRRVAGTIGRLSLSVYGTIVADCSAESMADDLGVALQLTNILRDVVEDRDRMGRVYLPAEDLERFGVGPDLSGNPSDLASLIAFEVAVAEEWYEKGLPLLRLLDRRSRACTAAMAGIYRQLLASIKRDPGAVFERRVSLPAPRKAAIAVSALTRGTV